ncbi:MAG: PQQ-dependent dehydrogenase, methanol/ethanol family [Terriglobia bacterium]
MRLSKCSTLSFVLLCLFAARWLAAQSSGSNPLAGQVEAIASGKKAYANYCQGCHGGDGMGGRGPSLAVAALKHGNEDAQLYQTIRQGIPGTPMPPFELSPNEIWELVSYLKTLRPSGKEEAVPGDPIQGRQIFAGKGECQRCHQVNGHGGRVGPDLSTAGHWTAQGLKDAILNPNQRITQKPEIIRLTTHEGVEIQGVRRNEDTFSIQIMDEQNELHSFQKKDLRRLDHVERSLMPADYGKRLSAVELQDLIAFLKTLRQRDLTTVAAAPLGKGLTFERLVHSAREPQNWMTYWGDYQGRHYSPLARINTRNVSTLRAVWAYQFPGNGVLEATPLVVDGVLYATGNSGHAFALDAASGRVIWQYQHQVKGNKPTVADNVNRGVALLGERVFFSTIDAYLVCLDAKTGRLLWETEMADPLEGYGATVAPLALRDKIICGISSAEFGIRGFIDAYDPASGERLWRFQTIPGPGELGHDTWEGDSWKRGGGSTWMTGTYDPELDTLYWGVGNPSPDFNGDLRKGDNLFTCSMVALEASSGKLKWYFQFTPHDTHDWDANETPVLVDRMFHGKPRKLLLHADRNAFFYVLDRVDGKFLLGRPFARQTWAKGLDESGKPILEPGFESSPEGQPNFPGVEGATNWQAPSYDPATGLLYLTFREAGDRYFKEPADCPVGKACWGGKFVPLEEREWGGVKAINPETGTIEWEYKSFIGTNSAGVLGTGGGVVFAGSRDGHLMALDSRNGKLLWRFQTGTSIHSSPMSYAVGSRQYVAISAGRVIYSFALPEAE